MESIDYTRIEINKQSNLFSLPFFKNHPTNGERSIELCISEKQLKEDLEKCRYLLKHAPTGIFEVGDDGKRFTSVNDAICQILGYTEEELKSLNPFDLIAPESKKPFMERVAKVLKGEKVPNTIECLGKRKDGQTVYFIASIKTTYKDGKADGAFVIAHDISELKKAEQKLAVSEKRYQRLFETTQDGIMARDLTGKMIDCNRAYAKMLGYTKKELRQLTVQDLLPEKWHEQRERIVNKVLLTGRSIVFEREYRRKDGFIFPASVRTWRLTDGKGKAIGMWSIVRDITEQKKHQKTLEEHAGSLERIVEERTKQLKDSERLAAIGQTAGMVGHDLRNPLQTITGEMYLAKRDIQSLPESEAKTNLQQSMAIMEEQSIYMDKIVSDLQAFVQPLRVDKELINLRELVSAVLSSVIIPNNITVETYAKDKPSQVKADPHLLKRVLINLATNAVQATPNGGTLTLTTQVNPKGQASVTVKDTGVGIPDSIKKQIFAPLFTTKPRGQGFGLAVCKRVIEAHGGTISFRSIVGKGAAFTVEFPAS